MAGHRLQADTPEIMRTNEVDPVTRTMGPTFHRLGSRLIRYTRSAAAECFDCPLGPPAN